MDQILSIAYKNLLTPAELSEKSLQNLLNILTGPKIDYADLYFQSSYSESWSLEEGIIKSGGFQVDKGVGVRAISGEKTGFAYSDDIYLPALQNAAKAARAISQQGSETKKIPIAPKTKLATNQLYQPINPITSLANQEKIALLQKIDSIARSIDPRIIQVNANLAAEYETILIMRDDGSLAADVRPLIRMNVSVVAQDGNRLEQGFAGGGGRYDYRYFIDNDLTNKFAKEAVRIALTNLTAVAAPAGLMPVVLGPGWPGVLLHEAVGHGLEGDFNRKETSLFSGKIGQQVTSKLCTVVDDGTIANRRGSLNIDDEGVPTQRTVLIENGILRSYMQDKMNARLMGVESTGNGRRESYASIPIPRMTNTFMLPGESTPDEIIKSVKKGIYAVNFSGGQVDITSGNFVFSTSEAWLIEDGKLTAPIKDATLIGNGPDVLTKVSMVGNDLKLDSGIGTCGKEGQNVPVGVGQPTVKIDELTVGGTNKK